MPKKKPVLKAVKKVVKKLAAKKPVPKTKGVAKKAKKALPAAKPSVKVVASPPKPKSQAKPPSPIERPAEVVRPEPVKNEPSLGRPLVTQEEKLYMLFHDDYQARQVFEFLRVVTVKELEEFSPHQIIHMMSKPLRMTVDRIRQRLAQYKRALKDDEQFATEFRLKGEGK